MNPEKPDNIGHLDDLVRKLSRTRRMARLAEASGVAVEEIASEAAASLLDIESACVLLREQLMPRLRALSPDSPDFDDVLDDIAEEYRHISYHIMNTRLFNYVVPGK